VNRESSRVSHLEHLEPDQRIVLRMAIRRRRSYEAVAEALGSTPGDVRGKALAAADALVPERPEGLEAEDRVRALEHLLGQQDPDTSAATSRRLAAPGPARDWALLLQERLAELGEPAAAVPPERAPAPSARQREPRPERAARTPRAPRAARAPRPKAAPRPRRGARADDEAADLPAADGRQGPAAPRRALAAVSSAIARLLSTRGRRRASGGVAAVVVVLLGLWIAGVFGGGEEDTGSTIPEASQNQALAVQFAAAMPRSITFRAPSGAPAEFASVRGVATPSVSSDNAAVPVLSLEITGLPAATASRRYFAWADRNGSDPALLGSLPDVSGAQLPFQGIDAASGQAVLIDPTVYSRVRVTAETTESPTSPGQTVIVGTITPPTS